VEHVVERPWLSHSRNPASETEIPKR